MQTRCTVVRIPHMEKTDVALKPVEPAAFPALSLSNVVLLVDNVVAQYEQACCINDFASAASDHQFSPCSKSDLACCCFDISRLSSEFASFCIQGQSSSDTLVIKTVSELVLLYGVRLWLSPQEGGG